MRYGTLCGSYSLTSLPGSPQICVSHGAFIHANYRGNGFGQADHKERLDRIKMLGYDLAICTVNGGNLAQKHILAKNGWTMAKTFHSSNSGHVVELWTREIV